MLEVTALSRKQWLFQIDEKGHFNMSYTLYALWKWTQSA